MAYLIGRETTHAASRDRALCGHVLDRSKGHRFVLWHEKVSCPKCRRRLAILRNLIRNGKGV